MKKLTLKDVRNKRCPNGHLKCFNMDCWDTTREVQPTLDKNFKGYTEEELDKLVEMDAIHNPLNFKVSKAKNHNTRPSPKYSATQFPPGYEMVGNDGNWWHVKGSPARWHRGSKPTHFVTPKQQEQHAKLTRQISKEAMDKQKRLMAQADNTKAQIPAYDPKMIMQGFDTYSKKHGKLVPNKRESLNPNIDLFVGDWILVVDNKEGDLLKRSNYTARVRCFINGVIELDLPDPARYGGNTCVTESDIVKIQRINNIKEPTYLEEHKTLLLPYDYPHFPTS